jgi:hypothetical protein
MQQEGRQAVFDGPPFREWETNEFHLLCAAISNTNHRREPVGPRRFSLPAFCDANEDRKYSIKSP